MGNRGVFMGIVIVIIEDKHLASKRVHEALFTLLDALSEASKPATTNFSEPG